MFHNFIKAFFIGQVAIEHASQASKKNFETAQQKITEYKEKYREKLTEYRSTNKEQVVQKVAEQVKDKIAQLRSAYTPFEHTCQSLSSLLSETSEPRNRLAVVQSKS